MSTGAVRCAVFRAEHGHVTIVDARVDGAGALTEWPFPGVRQAFFDSGSGTEASLFTCEAGSRIPMHAGEGWSYCTVLAGEGIVAAPDGSSRTYSGPAVFVFAPGALHQWDSTSDTTICVIYAKEPSGSDTTEGEA